MSSSSAPLNPSRVFSLERPSRKLISHVHQASIDSMDSASTADPASTAENEPRISISSTLYPASEQSNHDLYNDRPDSFIDLESPSNLHFDDLDEPNSAPASRIHFAKPPVPTAPKPVFNRKQPPMADRADLVRKSKKLTRVFGQTPSAATIVHPRPAHLLAGTVRRHSMPLSPDDLSFLSIASPPLDRAHFAWPDDRHRPESFIDLSDDDQPSPKPRLASKASFETLAPEDERRRKRERLAKLHRFLGSRVPAHLVLGLEDPALADVLPPVAADPADDGAARRAWLRRRRSSSAAALPSVRVDELERVREELDDKEKAINVRRAHKMEKVFGVAPPQTLFHTRCQSPSSRGERGEGTPPGTPTASSASASASALASASTSGSASAGNARARNSSGAHGKKAPKARKSARPGTAESSRQLLPKGDTLPPTPVLVQAQVQAQAPVPANERDGDGGGDGEQAAEGRHSYIYSHYQHSLNSLHDILDRDDRASLAELHEYLNSAEAEAEAALALDRDLDLDLSLDLGLDNTPTFDLDNNTPTFNLEFASNASVAGAAGWDAVDPRTPTTGDSYATGRTTVISTTASTTTGATYANANANANATRAARDRSLSSASSLRSERRRSLPAHTSLGSLASLAGSELTLGLGSPGYGYAYPAAGAYAYSSVAVYSGYGPGYGPGSGSGLGPVSGGIGVGGGAGGSGSGPGQGQGPGPGGYSAGPAGGADEFQQRRRRAAKLTQFFGVNYRELVTDVLESIESGVAQEEQRGTLRAEEVEDLLSKLRTLKTKRTGLF